MKRVILHVGMPKTGTTTIQEFCRVHRGALRAAGIDYPALYVVKSDEEAWASHEALMTALLLSPPARFVDEKPASIELVDRAFDDFRTNEASTLFLSHETLSRRDDLDFPRLQAWVADYDVTVIAFIRTFDEWLESLFQQGLRPENAPAKPFKATLLSQLPAMRYLPKLRALRDGLPGAEMRILSFEKFRRGRLMRKVLKLIGGATPDLLAEAGRVTKENVSRPVAEVMFCAYVSMATADPDVTRQVVQAFVQAHEAGHPVPLPEGEMRFIPATFKKQAREHYRRDLPRLRREFLVRVTDPGPVVEADLNYRTSLAREEYAALLAAIRPFLDPDIADTVARAYAVAHPRFAV